MTMNFESWWGHQNPPFVGGQASAYCSLKGDKVLLRPYKSFGLSVGVSRWYFQKTAALRDEWHFFPRLNWNSYGQEKAIFDNPTLEVRA